LGKTFKEDQRYQWLEGKRKSSEFMGTIPHGGSIIEKKEYIPPWRTENKIDKSLSSLLEKGKEEKLEKFIITGQK
jgi:hypothetical protein